MSIVQGINVRKDQYWYDGDTGEEYIVTQVRNGLISTTTINQFGNQSGRTWERDRFAQTLTRGRLPQNHLGQFFQYQPNTVWERRTGNIREIAVNYTIVARDGDLLTYFTHDPAYTFTISARGFNDFRPTFVRNTTVSAIQPQVQTGTLPMPSVSELPATSGPAPTVFIHTPPAGIVVGATYLAKSDGMPVQVDMVRSHNVVFHSDKRFFTYDHEKFRNLFDRAPELTPVAKPTKASAIAQANADGIAALKEKAMALPDDKTIQGINVNELKLAKENEDLRKENAELKKLLEQSYQFLSRRPTGYTAHMATLKHLFTPNQVLQQ